jgi:hypothetical protein
VDYPISTVVPLPYVGDSLSLFRSSLSSFFSQQSGSSPNLRDGWSKLAEMMKLDIFLDDFEAKGALTLKKPIPSYPRFRRYRGWRKPIHCPHPIFPCFWVQEVANSTLDDEFSWSFGCRSSRNGLVSLE